MQNQVSSQGGMQAPSFNLSVRINHNEGIQASSSPAPATQQSTGTCSTNGCNTCPTYQCSLTGGC